MSKVWLVRALLGALCVLLMATPAAAPPGNPSNPGDFVNNPHVTMPWAGNNPNVGGTDYGQVVQYIPVPPQQVAITLYVPVPDGIPPQTQQQTVEIPGYVVTETTTGFYYPERWTLQQMNVGVYQWMKLPAEFRRK